MIPADTVVIFPPLDDPYAPKELGKDSFESVIFEKPENAGDNVSHRLSLLSSASPHARVRSSDLMELTTYSIFVLCSFACSSRCLESPSRSSLPSLSVRPPLLPSPSPISIPVPLSPQSHPTPLIQLILLSLRTWSGHSLPRHRRPRIHPPLLHHLHDRHDAPLLARDGRGLRRFEGWGGEGWRVWDPGIGSVVGGEGRGGLQQCESVEMGW